MCLVVVDDRKSATVGSFSGGSRSQEIKRPRGASFPQRHVVGVWIQVHLKQRPRRDFGAVSPTHHDPGLVSGRSSSKSLTLFVFVPPVKSIGYLCRDDVRRTWKRSIDARIKPIDGGPERNAKPVALDRRGHELNQELFLYHGTGRDADKMCVFIGQKLPLARLNDSSISI